MLFTKEKIKNSQRWLVKKLPVIKRRCNLYFISSDPTRLKILYLLKRYQELCVSDLAEILQVSLSAVSHQLRLLERSGLVKKIRIGKMVCYSLQKQILKVGLIKIVN